MIFCQESVFIFLFRDGYQRMQPPSKRISSILLSSLLFLSSCLPLRAASMNLKPQVAVGRWFSLFYFHNPFINGRPSLRSWVQAWSLLWWSYGAWGTFIPFISTWTKTQSAHSFRLAPYSAFVWEHENIPLLFEFSYIFIHFYFYSLPINAFQFICHKYILVSIYIQNTYNIHTMF